MQKPDFDEELQNVRAGLFIDPPKALRLHPGEP
jgi:hypothetical protein